MGLGVCFGSSFFTSVFGGSMGLGVCFGSFGLSISFEVAGSCALLTSISGILGVGRGFSGFLGDIGSGFFSGFGGFFLSASLIDGWNQSAVTRKLLALFAFLLRVIRGGVGFGASGGFRVSGLGGDVGDVGFRENRPITIILSHNTFSINSWSQKSSPEL